MVVPVEVSDVVAVDVWLEVAVVVLLVVADVVADVVGDVVPVLVADVVGVEVAVDVGVVDVGVVVMVVVPVEVGVVWTQFAKLVSSNALTAPLSSATISVHSVSDEAFEDAAMSPPAKHVNVPAWVCRVNEVITPFNADTPLLHSTSLKPTGVIATAVRLGSSAHWNGEEPPMQPTYIRSRKLIRYAQSGARVACET